MKRRAQDLAGQVGRGGLRCVGRALVAFACALTLWGAGLSAGWAASPFEEGNALFKEGKFQEAEAAYNRSLAQEGDSCATRFNLGRVREALSDPAGAMIEWERALRLSPGDAAAAEALAGARATLGSKVDAPLWWHRVEPAFALGRERWIFATGLWLVGLAVVLWGFRRRAAAALVCGVSGMVLAFLGEVWSRHAAAEADAALVMERAASLRAAPADPARLLDSLPAGSRVRVLDASGGWNRVIAAGGEEGWLPSKSIERISAAGIRAAQ